MKKWLILLLLVIAGFYFFFWQTSFEGEIGKLTVLDEKFFGKDVLPNDEKMQEYKIALENYLKELNVKADSVEKKAVQEIVKIKLDALELLELKKEIELKEKLVNYNNMDCGPEESAKKAEIAFTEGLIKTDAIVEKIKMFEVKYSAYYAKAEKLQELKGTMQGYENYFLNSMEIIKALCGFK